MSQLPAWLTSRVGGLPRPFWYLWSGTLLNRLGSFVVPFLALYLTRSRGFSVAEAGVVLTFAGAGSAASQPIGGTLADRFGRRRTMVGGLVASSVALMGLGLAHAFPLLCASVFAYGLCLDLFRPASSAAMADLVTPEERPRAYALVFWAVNLGFAFATPIGGTLAAHSYWALFLLDAATSLGYAGLVLVGVPETRPERSADAGPASLAMVLRDPLLLALVGGTLLQAVVYLQAFSTLPLAFAHDHLGPGSYGAAIAANGIGIVLLQPLLLGRRSQRRVGRLLLAAAVLQGVGFGLTAFADDIPGHLRAIVVWTLGEILGSGLLSALVATLAPPDLRGRYMGVFGSSFGLAALLAPLLGTQVMTHFGESTLWGGCLVLSCASGVVLMRVSAAADRRASADECADRRASADECADRLAQGRVSRVDQGAEPGDDISLP